MNILKNRVFKNISWILLCKIAQALLGLAVSMFTARYLGPANFGKINYAASLVSFVSPIMMLGVNEIMVQELIRNPDSEGEIVGSSIAMCCCSALFCIAGISTFVFATNRNETDTLIVCILYSSILIFQAMELVQYWFQAKLLSKYSSIISLSAYVLFSLYRIILLITKSSIYWFAVANSLDACLIAIALIVVFKKLSGKRITVSVPCCVRLFSQGKYYIIANLMVVVFAQTDRIMLKMMIDNAATGFYSAAVNCVNTTAFVFSAIITSARPVILESHMTSYDKYELNVKRLYSVVIFLSLAQSIAITILAKPMILILYGAEFLPAISALRIIAWYTAFSYIGGIRNIWILSEGKQKYILPINFMGATANIIMNFILIPIMGINGAAIASLFTQIFTNVIVGYIIKPIRRNNRLILEALNPSVIINLINKK